MSHRKSKKTFVKKSTSKSSSTREHVACDCNLCKGAFVDPRTRASHMKKREVVRGLSGPSDRPSEIGTSSGNQIPMDFPDDFMEVDNDDDFVGEKEFNFLVTKPRKSKRRLDYH